MVLGIHNNNPYLQNIAISEELTKASKEKLEKRPRIDPSRFTEGSSPVRDELQPVKGTSDEGEMKGGVRKDPKPFVEDENVEKSQPSNEGSPPGSRIDIRI